MDLDAAIAAELHIPQGTHAARSALSGLRREQHKATRWPGMPARKNGVKPEEAEAKLTTQERLTRDASEAFIAVVTLAVYALGKGKLKHVASGLVEAGTTLRHAALCCALLNALQEIFTRKLRKKQASEVEKSKKEAEEKEQEVEKMKREAGEKEKEMEKMKREAGEKKGELETVRTELTTARTDLTTARTDLNTARETLGKLDTMRTDLKTRDEELKAATGKLETLETTRAELETMRTNLKTRDGELAAATSELKTAKTTRTELKTSLGQAVDELRIEKRRANSLDAELQRVKRVKAELQRRADVIAKVQRGADTAVAEFDREKARADTATIALHSELRKPCPAFDPMLTSSSNLQTARRSGQNVGGQREHSCRRREAEKM